MALVRRLGDDGQVHIRAAAVGVVPAQEVQGELLVVVQGVILHRGCPDDGFAPADGAGEHGIGQRLRARIVHARQCFEIRRRYGQGRLQSCVGIVRARGDFLVHRESLGRYAVFGVVVDARVRRQLGIAVAPDAPEIPRRRLVLPAAMRQYHQLARLAALRQRDAVRHRLHDPVRRRRRCPRLRPRLVQSALLHDALAAGRIHVDPAGVARDRRRQAVFRGQGSGEQLAQAGTRDAIGLAADQRYFFQLRGRSGMLDRAGHLRQFGGRIAAQ
ncbi:Uncharacterised protein [Bordetella pertussis]|nr:Uncharacterised protein [Bordetella pertussis]